MKSLIGLLTTLNIFAFSHALSAETIADGQSASRPPITNVPSTPENLVISGPTQDLSKTVKLEGGSGDGVEIRLRVEDMEGPLSTNLYVKIELRCPGRTDFKELRDNPKSSSPRMVCRFDSLEYDAKAGALIFKAQKSFLNKQGIVSCTIHNKPVSLPISCPK